MSRFVFLDRDGTLVRDVGYPHRLEDYELLPGVVEALQRLSRAGFRLAIITNQSGIGRGIFTWREYEAFHARLLEDLRRAGVRIERTYVCPHAPEAGCRCRKPAPELLSRARRELHAELSASWVIGDAESDVELARRAGCRGAVRLVPAESGEAGAPAAASAGGRTDPASHRDALVRSAPNLEQAVQVILHAHAEPSSPQERPAGRGRPDHGAP